MTIRDKILVVEDEKTISGLIKAILTAAFRRQQPVFSSLHSALSPGSCQCQEL